MCPEGYVNMKEYKRNDIMTITVGWMSFGEGLATGNETTALEWLENNACSNISESVSDVPLGIDPNEPVTIIHSLRN